MEGLGHAVEELLHHLETLSIDGHGYAFGEFVLTNYIFFNTLAIILIVTFFMYGARKAALVPQGRLANMAEAGVEFVRDSLVGDIIGHKGRPYWPFIGTVFFFVLFNNLLGLIPGGKPGTGTMGVTVAIAVIVFVVFNTIGIKKQGAVGYLKGLVPHGVPGWIAPLIWLLEVVSLFMRPFTLSVRLFANMYAGHIILGVFAALIHLAVEPAIEHLSTGSVLAASPAIIWLILMTALYALEVLVAFVQAYVFTLLTTVYINGALEAH